MRVSPTLRPPFVWFALAVVSATTVVTTAQRPPTRMPTAGGTSSATRVISPVALVTWVARYGADGGQTLDLLVLWRGAAPGWFTKGSGSGTSSGGNSESFHSTIRYGGLTLQLDLQLQTQVATIQGKRLEMRGDNVIMVDDVDSGDGLRIVRTLRVDPELPRTDKGLPMIESVLRRSPEVLQFLGCDTRLPDERAQTSIDQICRQVLGN